MMQGEETQVKETRKHFIIITPNFLEASTGGLVWLDQFAKYARTVNPATTILDVMKLKPWIRKNRLINILYYFVWLFRKNNAFIFVDHNLHMRLSLPLLICTWLKQNSYAVITFHLLHNLREHPVGKKLEYWSERLILRHASKVIVCSDKTRLDVEHMGVAGDKIQVIHPTGLYKNEKLPVRSDQKRILFVGNIEPRKGLSVLIEALGMLKGIEFTLDIVGGHFKQEGHYNYLKNSVKNLGITDRVVFHGKVESDAMKDFYRKANIFAFPSLHEGYGMVLLEAMSFGLPIIASNIAPITEILKSPDNGYLFSVANARALAVYLKELLEDHKMQTEIGKRNFEVSRNFASWDQVVRQTYQALQPYFNNANRN
jgi:glycosyltransferase involved in cell wall biosynthesis